VVAGQQTAENGLLYVLATQVYEGPRSFNQFGDQAVLAAFDDAGVELWRIELGGMPIDVVVVDGDPWVLQLADSTVSRFDAADGRILGHVTLDVADVSSWMIEAFGAMWVGVNNESPGGRPHLVRIDPDLSTTSIELLGHHANLMSGCDSCHRQRRRRRLGAAGCRWGGDGRPGHQSGDRHPGRPHRPRRLGRGRCTRPTTAHRAERALPRDERRCRVRTRA
jgi:hypothetical protein